MAAENAAKAAKAAKSSEAPTPPNPTSRRERRRLRRPARVPSRSLPVSGKEGGQDLGDLPWGVLLDEVPGARNELELRARDLLFQPRGFEGSSHPSSSPQATSTGITMDPRRGPISPVCRSSNWRACLTKALRPPSPSHGAR